MTKLRLAYVGSLLAAGALALVAALPALFSASPAVEVLEPVQSIQLLERDDRWIIQVDFVNPEAEGAEFTARLDLDGGPVVTEFSVPARGKYTLVHHIYPADVGEGVARLSIYRQGEPQPLEQVTYHLDPKGRALTGATSGRSEAESADGA